MAGSLEPGWELGHAVLHLEASRSDHGVREHDPHSTGPDSFSILAADDELGHQHPVFHSPAKPSADLILAILALPSESLDLRSATSTVPRATLSGTPARASPGFEPTSQPRAPPLA